MRIANRLLRSGFFLLAALLAGSAVADSRTVIAPPGPCAEPRETTAYVAPGSAAAVATDSFDVVGPIQNLFDPVDVAATPSGPSPVDQILDRPAPKPLIRPGACDNPGTGCGLNAAIPSQNPPIIPGVRPQP